MKDLLRSCASVELDAGNTESIRRACLAEKNWKEAIRQAELHGLSPYLYWCIKETDATVPKPVLKKLQALTLRHAQSSRLRTDALLEIVQTLRNLDIEVLVLKGAALAHLVYQKPALRPMRDIDLLVAPEQLDRASIALADLGYRSQARHGLLPDHHHLPTMAKESNGLMISVEIHHNALTPDNIGSIQLSELSEPPHDFTVDSATMRTLGHVDMLRHLCRHALEPSETIKLGSALDIMLYATHFAEQIDWPRLEREFPEVITMLQLLGYLVPRPSALDRLVSPPAGPPPRAIGEGMIPLSQLRRRKKRFSKLFNPSEWWLRAFYNVPPGRSLAYTRAVRHPMRVFFWLWRRKSKAPP